MKILKLFLCLAILETSLHTANAYPAEDAADFDPDYRDNPERPRYSGIGFDCDDLVFCQYIKAGKLKDASRILHHTSPDALNIASIIDPYLNTDPILVWLIKNNTEQQYTNLILQLINKPGIDVNKAHFLKKITPLHAAILANDSQILQALLLKGANPRTRTGYSHGFSYTTVELAIKNEFYEIAEILEEWTPKKKPARTHTAATTEAHESENSPKGKGEDRAALAPL